MSNAGGDTVWEFMVTVDPSADRRMLSGADGNLTTIGKGATEAAGVLMIGTLTFTTGQLSGMSAFTLKSNGGVAGPKDLNNWSLADFSTGGYPVFTANFLGKSDASTAQAANATPIQMDFGISNKDLSSDGGGAVTKGWNSSLGTLPTNANAAQLANVDNSGWLPNFKDPAVSALATQSYDTGGSSTLFQSQDGYSAGILQNISVSREGVLTGHYSNGQVLELYAVTLATFTTQRGFQANTKVITTTDSMLGEVIAMKR
jgi:flagellar hook protein FlgE